jgi:Na+/H+ antiporter
VTSNRPDGDIGDDSDFTGEERKQTLEQFRAFLRSLLMHAGVGTALGGVMTMVGEPQNLIIAKSAGGVLSISSCVWRRSRCRCWCAACWSVGW